MTIAHTQLHLALLLLDIINIRLALCMVLREKHALRLSILRRQPAMLIRCIVRLHIV